MGACASSTSHLHPPPNLQRGPRSSEAAVADSHSLQALQDCKLDQRATEERSL